ncbi:hypothetical protein [Mangrovimonas cancribranchiae]|uniref:Peptidase M41 n=1 Tax=Mangrovimonas cancribranchiae TaxID=3080055 RepID=A0AAU6P0T6_9FLAO
MSKQLDALKANFVKKQEQLGYAKKQLKKEFFGIDHAIDQLINQIRPWYILNDYQDRPLIINLWGLTGVGKTSLIQRMAELMHYSNKLYRFDLGDKRNSSLHRDLEELSDNNEENPIMIMLDEFQHSRTLKGPMREEINEDANRKVWDLIDSGKIEYHFWKRGLYNFITHVELLKHLLKAGIKVKNGVVVEGVALFNSELEKQDHHFDFDNDGEQPCQFVQRIYYSDIVEFSSGQLGVYLMEDVKSHLMTLDGDETIMFLDKVIRIAKKPNIKKFTKALIFVVGNLDEAYSMSGVLSADINADNFHEASLKITLPQIKRALSCRFRKEQIARLGNNHIIYPSLNKEAYNQIIAYELTQISQKVKDGFGIYLTFSEALSGLIYKEGVFPTQGVRPVKTTVNFMVQSNLPEMISEIMLKYIDVDTINLTYLDNHIIAEYFNAKHKIHKKTFKVSTPLEDMRKPKQNDIQAITAVHESGHAVLSAILLQVVPEHVCSMTSDPTSFGYVHTKWPWKYIAKHEIEKRVAVYLGGLVAEELVFGEDYITTGASEDISQATRFVGRMLKYNGLGNTPIEYNTDENDNLSYHDTKEIELDIKQIVEKGLELAKETLKKEIVLLLKLSDFLSDHSSINKLQLEKLIKAHKVSNVDFITNGDNLFYRKTLKKKISQDLKQVSRELFESVTLNKKDNI